MTSYTDRIKDVLDTAEVALFMKGTPDAIMCGNSERALGALRRAGAPITAVDLRGQVFRLTTVEDALNLYVCDGAPIVPALALIATLASGSAFASTTHSTTKQSKPVTTAQVQHQSKKKVSQPVHKDASKTSTTKKAN